MTTRKNRGVPADVPGNAIETAAQRQRFLVRLGKGWVDFCDACQRASGHGLFITGMTIKGELGEPDEILVVLRAEGEEGAVVAFHSTAEPLGLWTGLAARMDNGNLKWRKDEYR